MAGTSRQELVARVPGRSSYARPIRTTWLLELAKSISNRAKGESGCGPPSADEVRACPPEASLPAGGGSRRSRQFTLVPEAVMLRPAFGGGEVRSRARGHIASLSPVPHPRRRRSRVRVQVLRLRCGSGHTPAARASFSLWVLCRSSRGARTGRAWSRRCPP